MNFICSPALFTCTRCKVEKPEDGFYRRKQGGRYSHCIDCQKSSANAWYAKNPNERSRRAKEWREANAERVKQFKRENRRRYYFSEAKRKYGIGKEEFDAMLDKQGGACAICRVPFDWENRKAKPNIDHCHTTGKVRGLLCMRCNSVVGLVDESRALLEALIGYVECHS